MGSDWDNLIILDGCRYDLFKECNTLGGKLSAVISPGSSSSDFLKAICSYQHHDTVYVTANPHYEVMGFERVFHDVIPVWDFGWDETLKTVPPERMAEATKEAHSEYPNKRILAQFMQPHYPFLGESADEVGPHAGFEYSVRTAKTGEGSRDNETIWNLLKYGNVDREAVLHGYRLNLELVLGHVEELIELFDEKTVVSSDHGNLVGEFVPPFPRRKYGHPSGFHANQLVKVPWLVTEGSSRKTVSPEPPSIDEPEHTEQKVEERLSDLGYLE